MCILFKIYLTICMASMPQCSWQCFCLLDVRAEFKPQVRNQNENTKIFFRRLTLSRFLAKILRVNTIAMKKILKNLSLGIDVKLQVPPLMCKIKTQHKWCEKLDRNPDGRVVMINYVCICLGIYKGLIYNTQLPWSSKQCVGLLVAKAWDRIPGQSSKMKSEKYLFGEYLSTDFWQNSKSK